jgi:hypothetical protein
MASELPVHSTMTRQVASADQLGGHLGSPEAGETYLAAWLDHPPVAREAGGCGTGRAIAEQDEARRVRLVERPTASSDSNMSPGQANVFPIKLGTAES